jgi:hypothetical protein
MHALPKEDSHLILIASRPDVLRGPFLDLCMLQKLARGNEDESAYFRCNRSRINRSSGPSQREANFPWRWARACKEFCVNGLGYDFGSLSSNRMANRAIAAFQLMIGFFHFFVMLFRAR